MLTGDNAATAMEMARNLGIDDVRAGLMPEEKAGIIEDAVRRNGLVGMVGDGVNDAPALAVASVGVCMGTVAGAVTSQAADVVLVNDNLESIPRLVALSRRTVKTIRFNVAFALVTKVIVVVLAVMGLAGFWMAMAADVGVSLLVVAHALRLLRFDAT
jgi:Cd2+/Zn2+-exporting ATPase